MLFGWFLTDGTKIPIKNGLLIDVAFLTFFSRLFVVSNFCQTCQTESVSMQQYGLGFNNNGIQLQCVCNGPNSGYSVIKTPKQFRWFSGCCLHTFLFTYQRNSSLHSVTVYPITTLFLFTNCPKKGAQLLTPFSSQLFPAKPWPLFKCYGRHTTEMFVEKNPNNSCVTVWSNLKPRVDFLFLLTLSQDVILLFQVFAPPKPLADWCKVSLPTPHKLPFR